MYDVDIITTRSTTNNFIPHDPLILASRGYTDQRTTREIAKLLRDLCEQKFSFPFVAPVDQIILPDYAIIIKQPMDLGTIQKNIATGMYKSTREIKKHVDLVW